MTAYIFIEGRMRPYGRRLHTPDRGKLLHRTIATQDNCHLGQLPLRSIAT